MIKSPTVPDGYEEYNYRDSSTAELTVILVEIHGDRCWYCDIPFVEIENHRHSRTIDHFHSQDFCKKNQYSFEQTHGLTNLVLAHKCCNSSKSNRTWLDDGTLSPRGRVRLPKTPRPSMCDTCMSGRILLAGEVCPDCGSGPQPASAPTAYQLSPKQCSHEGDYFCWMCFLGFVPRKNALTWSRKENA